MLLFSVSKNMRVCAMAAVIFVSFFVGSPSLWSQQSSTAALTAYTTAVQISDPAKRLAAMELFLRSEPDSSLAQDALECATWDAIRLGDAARSARWASELLKRSPASPLAQAALATSTPPRSAEGVETLRNALASLDRIHKPEGFSEAELAEMRRQVWLLLDGSIGLAYVALQQYEDSLPYLKLAVSVAPNDPRFTYSYALALLSGKNPDTKNGYWQLARAVNLNAGSPAGAQIAQYARSKYLEDGGSDADWKQFVAVTSIGTRNQTKSHGGVSAPAQVCNERDGSAGERTRAAFQTAAFDRRKSAIQTAASYRSRVTGSPASDQFAERGKSQSHCRYFARSGRTSPPGRRSFPHGV